MYQFLGFFWIIMGVLLLVLPHIYPDLADYPVIQNRVPMAGFCFALSIYNMIRWRLMRAREISRRELLDQETRRRDQDRPIDPTFDFSEHAPPPDEKKR